MEKTEKPQPSAVRTVRRLLAMAGRLRGWLYAALAVDLLLAASILLSNHFMRRFFEMVVLGDAERVWMYALLVLGVFLLGVPLSWLKMYGTGRFSEGALARVRSALAARSTVLPVETMEARHSGDLLSVLNADLGKLKTLLNNNLLDLVGNAVRGVAALAYIISINWVLALVATILTPAIFLVISKLTRPVMKRSEEMQAEIGQVNSVAQDGLSGAMVVKSFNLARLMDERFHLVNAGALKKGLAIARLRAIIDGVTIPMSLMPFIIALGLGGYFIIQGKMTFGSLFAFINLLNYVVNPLSFLPQVFASIGEASGAAARVFELLDEPAERTGGPVTGPSNHGSPAVAFKDLTFAYKNGNPVLSGLSLEIPHGKTTAVVGPSGSGKSTLVKLILGCYTIPDGKVQLLGSDLNQWQLPAARRQMAFVAQDSYLFPTSIAENIRLGRPDATQAEIEEAARQANIHDFIVTLPQGYQTGAGEWGSRLSGGQRQRISLARAILKGAPILLLDEPTSALDTESEALVQQALERFAAGRTTLVIAHRLSTIKNADQVLVLKDGAVVEQGTHEELLARGGVYLELYRQHFQNGHAPASREGRN